MNTNSLAGTLEEKLRAVKGAGFRRHRALRRGPGGPSRRARRRGRAGQRQRPQGQRVPDAARFRGPVRTHARLQDRRRPLAVRHDALGRRAALDRRLDDIAARQRRSAQDRGGPGDARDAGGAAGNPHRLRRAGLGTLDQRVHGGVGGGAARRARQRRARDRFVSRPGPGHLARAVRRDSRRADLPRPARRLPVGHGRPHRDRAPPPRVPFRGQSQRRRSSTSSAASSAPAIAATTLSTWSTTITRICRPAAVAARGRKAALWLGAQTSRPARRIEAHDPNTAVHTHASTAFTRQGGSYEACIA